MKKASRRKEKVLKQGREADLLRFSTAGSVDDGKSTLIGRLLYEAHGLYEDQLAAVRKDSARLKREALDLSLVMDGLKAEREQAITIDVAYRYFSTPQRHFIIADTPGHEQYTRNMATGASTADLAVILIDARRGVLLQSKRHAFIASLLGIKHMVIAVNKMDLVGYSEKVFRKIARDFEGFAEKLNVPDTVYIPVSALKGDNVVRKSRHMKWYDGPALLNHLENVHVLSDRNLIDLRFPVQYVLRPGQDFRGYAGRIASGVIRKGDEVLALPSQRRTRIRSIRGPDGAVPYAFAPQSVTVTLEDEIDITRGDMLVHSGNLPQIRREIESILVWMDPSPLALGKVYWIKHTTQLFKCSITRLPFRIDPGTLSRKKAAELKLNEIGRVTVQCFRSVFCDEYTRNRQTGSFILIDPMTHATVAAGMIIERGRLSSMVRPDDTAVSQSALIHRQEGDVPHQERERLLKQKPATLWLTGLSGSGKSTVAYEVEKKLMAAGHLCYVLDGDNVRHGLNRDLGFSPQDRSENIRRVAEVARLLNEAGVIVITAFISPYREDRAKAGEIIGRDRFIEIFLDAPVEVCEKRDPKGLYEKARAGLITEFTGVNAPYEVPEAPALLLDTAVLSADIAADQIIRYLARGGFLG
ncbi:MAG TPA: sulfate adenylyltransferase subunit CysN [Candidatus Omnitrophota bacterium]|nr:sulfate adenylyltransferase subunit CysN [Candidatus Omnitrophota bacterium]HPS36284.1 sulfate adenylyltransferase subunit CysN [Candidatus Omnitrophota bacterium]